MIQTWSENVYLVDVCPLLHLPTVTHSVLPSPVQSMTSHFHCSLGGEILHITLSKDCLSPDESCSSAVTVKSLLLGHPCTPSHPLGKLLPGEWGQHRHGDGMWDTAGHEQGLPQLQGRTIWGKKGGEETSSIDASGQHGFHGNPSSLFLLGVDATKRLLT